MNRPKQAVYFRPNRVVAADVGGETVASFGFFTDVGGNEDGMYVCSSGFAVDGDNVSELLEFIAL
jgi:hypothetical protein